MRVNATSRTVGVSKNTVLKLLVDAASVCSAFMDREFRDLPCKRIQVDEAWAFIYAKEKNMPRAKAVAPEAGDVWTWVTLDADTKPAVTWRVATGARPRRSICSTITASGCAAPHIAHLRRVERQPGGRRGRLRGRRRLRDAVKVYGNSPDGDRSANARYSPGDCTGTHVIHVNGRPDPAHINTSFIERYSLTMRMSMRRYTRLTNAFSKKPVNHTAQVALHMFHHNFVKPHRSLKNACQGSPHSPGAGS